MADRSPHPEFASELLRQDATLQSPQYQEHRMQLEQQLIRAESRERLTKRVVIGALLTAVAAFAVLASQALGSPDPGDKDATIWSVAAGVIYALAWATVFIGVASYYSRFLPRVRRAREELQAQTIREIRSDIQELRRLLAGISQQTSGNPNDTEK